MCVCVSVLPVSMRCGQAVRVHVPVRCGRDAVAVHGPNHGVRSSLQKQTDQLKVPYSTQTAESSLVVSLAYNLVIREGSGTVVRSAV